MYFFSIFYTSISKRWTDLYKALLIIIFILNICFFTQHMPVFFSCFVLILTKNFLKKMLICIIFYTFAVEIGTSLTKRNNILIN